MQVLNTGAKQSFANSFSCFMNIVKHETVSRGVGYGQCYLADL